MASILPSEPTDTLSAEPLGTAIDIDDADYGIPKNVPEYYVQVRIIGSPAVSLLAKNAGLAHGCDYAESGGKITLGPLRRKDGAYKLYAAASSAVILQLTAKAGS